MRYLIINSKLCLWHIWNWVYIHVYVCMPEMSDNRGYCVFLFQREHKKLLLHNQNLLSMARSLGFKILDTFNMTMARYSDFLQGQCACHFHRVSSSILLWMYYWQYNKFTVLLFMYSELNLNKYVLFQKIRTTALSENFVIYHCNKRCICSTSKQI